MKILFIGDVQGESNAAKLKNIIPDIKRTENIDLTIVNGENSADTNGITPASASLLFSSGADVITTGNHAFKRAEMDSMFNERAEVLRPANYGAAYESCPGKGMHILDFGYCRVCVINIMGTVFMPPCDNPFKCVDEILEQVDTPNIIVDFHAEATSEKKAMAFHLSKRVSAVIGTHTHVQTADEQIIQDFTAFISDVGMVGAVDSVIGADKKIVKKFIDYYPQKNQFADGEGEFNAVIIEIDTATGQSKSIKRIRRNI